LLQTRFEKQRYKKKKETFDDILVIFSPNISSALEISYNEVKIENRYQI